MEVRFVSQSVSQSSSSVVSVTLCPFINAPYHSLTLTVRVSVSQSSSLSQSVTLCLFR